MNAPSFDSMNDFYDKKLEVNIVSVYHGKQIENEQSIMYFENYIDLLHTLPDSIENFVMVFGPENVNVNFFKNRIKISVKKDKENYEIWKIREVK